MDSARRQQVASHVPGWERRVGMGIRHRLGAVLLVALAMVGTTVSSGASATSGTSSAAGVSGYLSCADSVEVPWKSSGRIHGSGSGYCTDSRGDDIPRIRLTVYLQRYSSRYGWQTRATKVKNYYGVHSGPSYEGGPAKPWVGCGAPWTTQRFRSRVKVEAYSGSSGNWVREAWYTGNSSSGYKTC